MRKNLYKLTISFLLILVMSICLVISGNPNVANAYENNSPYPLYEEANSNVEEVYLGGIPLGITVHGEGLIVVSLTDVITKDGAKMPQRDGEILVGDQIIEVNGVPITTLEGLRNSLIDGKPQKLTLKRGSEVRAVTIIPELDKITGTYKIGIMVKEEVSGIGTLTFITKDNKYGALGHRIADSETGLSFELSNGKIFEATVTGVVKGEKGKAGGLQGGFSKLATPIGTINKNTSFGIFGNFSGKYNLQKIMTADKNSVRMGKAQIYTTIKGQTPKLYDIEIIKCTQQFSRSEKGLVFNVTDKELLEATGGIVQGMSGSPIVQNGKLVGAVTHVFINDPTHGYGIYTEFMLEEANS
ncbi:MAG: SpoIVB peptidase [Clostridia bacterium]|nr:SpoIVB peptidase [Clostridia bacterium]